MNILPHHDFLLVRPITEGKTPGGVIIPDGANTSLKRGEVLAVGPGLVTEAGIHVYPSLSAGDIVHFRVSPAEIKVNGETLLLLSERDVMATEGDPKTRESVETSSGPAALSGPLWSEK